MEGYPDMEMNPFINIDDLHDTCRRFGLLNNDRPLDTDCPSFSVARAFFGEVVDALKVLKGQVKLEILQGDLMHELAQMRLGGDHSRPSDFPRRYTRMWMSNVP